MIGDKIVVKKYHTRAAEGVVERLRDKILSLGRPAVITVAGESGSGKSEIGSEIARILKEKDSLEGYLFHQDDYFIRPPKSNDEARQEDISNVGMHEVKLDLLDSHIAAVKNKDRGVIKKPLIDYNNNLVLEEAADLSDVDIAVAEGTYTTSLKEADFRVFIDRTYKDTLQHRKERARDELNEYTEKILIIEHKIISEHKKLADIVISSAYEVI